MKSYIQENEWKIIEEGFLPERHKESESIFSLGNGHMGQRANFEETYTGPSLQGNYIAGIYYPDKTKVGWWKIGYPEYFAKVLNAPSWIGIRLLFDQELDLHTMSIIDFERTLDMKKGILSRSFTAEWSDGKQVHVECERFLSMVRRNIGALSYKITPLNFNGSLRASLFLNADVYNQDSNYQEKFWDLVNHSINGSMISMTTKTRKSGFSVATSMATETFLNGSKLPNTNDLNTDKQYSQTDVVVSFKAGDEITLRKYASVVTSRDHSPREIETVGYQALSQAFDLGYEQLKAEHIDFWKNNWRFSDIRIEGDISAQQGIRFNIFQLNQTYTGHDPRLNIGPKGFTGEKYGGGTYWDTEAFCLPFYLNTTNTQIARNLLLYRYHQLDKAIENAEKLGFREGAALFPMVTMNGEECHNEWEITFEEIHRNGAIAYAINNYIRHTGDRMYLAEYGIEVLIAISRFWAQRVNFSAQKNKFVILGVTGPNEYENNVNNNWYTNYIAAWTLRYTLESIEWVKENHPKWLEKVKDKTRLTDQKELTFWKTIIDHIYLPEDLRLGIFLQQDGYLDKEQLMVDEIPGNERPINQNWSWDRILRSCFIKQADVLQGLYFFEDQFDGDIIRKNFDFYEPRTVHESSLSPCIHSILAAYLKKPEKAYELYLRTSRLDLDDYNHEVHEGCHITSMAGTWLAVIEGFGGMRVIDDMLHFAPLLPESWKSLSFHILFRERHLFITINHREIMISNSESGPLSIAIGEKIYEFSGSVPLTVKLS